MRNHITTTILIIHMTTFRFGPAESVATYYTMPIAIVHHGIAFHSVT